MRKSRDKTNIVRTKSDSVSIGHGRSDTTRPLIGKPVIERGSGKEATRLLKVDPTGIETTSLERRRARRKRKRIPVGDIRSLVPKNEGGDRKLNKVIIVNYYYLFLAGPISLMYCDFNRIPVYSVPNVEVHRPETNPAKWNRYNNAKEIVAFHCILLA